MMPRVSALHIYPIKSCGGLSVPADAARSAWSGAGPTLHGGRRQGAFSDPTPGTEDGARATYARAPELLIDAPGMQQIKVALGGWACASGSDPGLESQRGGRVRGGRPGRVVQPSTLGALADSCAGTRTMCASCDPAYARFESQVAFADGFPVLLISEASLEDLNSAHGETRSHGPLPTQRRGRGLRALCRRQLEADPHRGSLLFDVVKPCGRCVTTTVDQTTGEVGKEPLKTLATYRRRGNAVFFGQNCVHHGPGMVRVGDEVERDRDGVDRPLHRPPRQGASVVAALSASCSPRRDSG